MLFTGNYSLTIDAKGRLVIPADIRARWRTEVDGSAWFAVPRMKLIRLYTETDFHRTAANAPLNLMPGEDQAEAEVTLFGMSERLEIDSAGRIRIPDEMRELVGIGTSISLVGVRDRLEVRDQAEWQASKAQRLARAQEWEKRMAGQYGGGPGPGTGAGIGR